MDIRADQRTVLSDGFGSSLSKTPSHEASTVRPSSVSNPPFHITRAIEHATIMYGHHQGYMGAAPELGLAMGRYGSDPSACLSDGGEAMYGDYAGGPYGGGLGYRNGHHGAPRRHLGSHLGGAGVVSPYMGHDYGMNMRSLGHDRPHFGHDEVYLYAGRNVRASIYIEGSSPASRPFKAVVPSAATAKDILRALGLSSGGHHGPSDFGEPMHVLLVAEDHRGRQHQIPLSGRQRLGSIVEELGSSRVVLRITRRMY